MINTKNTKRALLSSVMALFLCFAMLLGTTYAWFTDSVTSANNIIQSGNLDIELDYWNGTEWNTVEGADDIINGDLWEPGYTKVAYLRLRNAGSLALKYQLGVNILSEKEGINQAGGTFKLSDYIEFGVIEGIDGQTAAYQSREAALAAVTDAKIISDGYTKADSLDANSGYVYLAMVVYMPTDVGNVANHDGEHIPQIDLGISVLATQFTKENDSFDEKYDEFAGETHFMANGVNYTSFDEAVKNATPDANGVVTYFIGGEAVFSGGWEAPIAPAGTTKVVIKGTGAETASLNLAHTYRNSLHADGMVVEISDITIDCDPCGTHQDTRNIWVFANELYATNVVFMDPADASNVKVAVFDGCTFASATADEEPSGGNYQLWVGDHDANYGSVTESVIVKNSVFESGRRAIKLAPTTGSASYTAVIDNNVFYDITYKPAVCLNYGTQANAVTIINNTLYNTALVEDEVNGNYTESNNTLMVTTAEALRNIAENSIGDVVVALGADITLGDDTTQKSMGAYFPNATSVTINGNDKTLTLKGQMPGSDWEAQYYTGIIAPNATVTVKDLTVVNEKLGNNGTNISADRKSVYTMVRGTSVLFGNVDFVGGVQVVNNTKFVDCTFVEDVLVANAEGYATNGKFCVFIDFEYNADGVCTVDFESCTFNASGYGCVKVAGDKGANITVNVKDSSFTNTCPSNSWSQTTPKYDVKMTGDNITVNDLGGNTWSKGFGKG